MLKPPRPSYTELVSQLQSLDQRRNWFSTQNTPALTPPMAFYEQQRPRYPQSSIRYQDIQLKDQNHGYSPSQSTHTQHRRPPPPGQRRMTSDERNLYREEKCQYCGMVGHIAKICWWVPKRPI